jgi:hypothetical protein
MAKGKTVNYSDSEREILAVLKEANGEPLTLEEIGIKLGKKITTGHINALVNTKGNVVYADKDREIEVKTIKTVKQYLFNKDIPE